MIEITVAVPMFRAKYCGWIALESLVRQTDINFDWELIVAEEIDNESFTKDQLMEYKKRLKAVGCVKITYIPLRYWEMLSNKLSLMAHSCSKKSKIFATNSADLYSSPKRLKTQYNLFMGNDNIDTCSSGRSIVYDIKSERIYLNDSSLKLIKKPNMRISDGIMRCVRMDLMRKLPRRANLKKTIDAWVYRESKLLVEKTGKKFNHHLDLTTDNWKYALNVHGLNNITMKVREKRFAGKRPFGIVDCPINIKNTIPQEILKRLKESKKYLNLHEKGLPNWNGNRNNI